MCRIRSTARRPAVRQWLSRSRLDGRSFEVLDNDCPRPRPDGGRLYMRASLRASRGSEQKPIGKRIKLVTAARGITHIVYEFGSFLASSRDLELCSTDSIRSSAAGRSRRYEPECQLASEPLPMISISSAGQSSRLSPGRIRPKPSTCSGGSWRWRRRFSNGATRTDSCGS